MATGLEIRDFASCGRIGAWSNKTSRKSDAGWARSKAKASHVVKGADKPSDQEQLSTNRTKKPVHIQSGTRELREAVKGLKTCRLVAVQF